MINWLLLTPSQNSLKPILDELGNLTKKEVIDFAG